jgi:hypothetical protein
MSTVRLFTCTSFDEPPHSMHPYQVDASPAQLISEAMDNLGREYDPNDVVYLATAPGSKAILFKSTTTLHSVGAMNGMVL